MSFKTKSKTLSLSEGITTSVFFLQIFPLIKLTEYAEAKKAYSVHSEKNE